MTKMDLSEFLRSKYTQKLQEVLQEMILDVTKGSKDLGIVGITALSVALDFVEQARNLVPKDISDRDYDRYLSDMEKLIAIRIKAIRDNREKETTKLRLLRS